MLAVVRQRSGAGVEKPQEICRGYASRLPWAWDGLCFGMPINETSREGFRDVVNNLLPSTITGSNWTRDSLGNTAISFTVGNHDYVEWADTPRHDRPSTALTAYVRTRNTGLANNDAGLICNVYSLGTPWSTWSLQAVPADVNKLYANLTLGTTPTTIGNTGDLPTTQYSSVFLRWRSGEAPRLDVLGERGDTLSSVTHGSTLTGSLGYNSGQGIRLNASESTGLNFDCPYSQAMVWSRRLTDTEMASLVSDPFGWYSPRRETVVLAGPYPVVAVTGSRTSPFEQSASLPSVQY